MRILGISAFYHDSAACLVEDGVVVAAAQEERFSRKKHDASLPLEAMRYCLAEGGDGVDAVAFYDKPILKLHRILETYLSVAPRGLGPFLQAIPLWLKDRLWVTPQIHAALAELGADPETEVYFTEHHESHAASAFYPSPFERAATVTLDGVGEWATATIGVGEGSRLQLVEEIRFPHSLGLLYSAFTYFTGFRVNSGEYKLMGLAPYGEPVYKQQILEELLDLKEDGSFRLNLSYFDYLAGWTMTNRRFARLFGGPARKPETPISRREMDLARSIQAVTEEIVLRVARHARRITGERNVCLAGGVALNCVANGELLRSGIFDELWVQPAAGDAGGAVGAALALHHMGFDGERPPLEGAAAPGDEATAETVQTRGVVAAAGSAGAGSAAVAAEAASDRRPDPGGAASGARSAAAAPRPADRMAGSYLGPSFPAAMIAEYLDANGCPYRHLGEGEWAETLARLIAEENVVGLFHGRMEFGPRALGNRSIVGDPRSPKMQSVMNLKIKYRESFRPFAPSCLEERIGDFFAIDRPSPYMLLVAQVREERCNPPRGDERDLPLTQWVNRPRSDVPAITHVDYSARIQSVARETNPRYHALIEAFERLTGYGILINTSFNVRGEPIVCTPEDAYRCFMRTEMDYLVLEDFLLTKTGQPNWQDRENWREVFELD